MAVDRATRNNIVYGADPRYLDEAVRDGLYAKTMGAHDGAVMLAMSILSDAQELLEMGRQDECRQYINRAKYVLSQHVMVNK